MKREIIISLIIGCSMPIKVSAQEQDAIAVQGQDSITHARKAWTMDECIEYAINHSTAVQMQLVEARQNKADYTAAKLSFLPTVEAAVSAQYSWGRNVDPETNTYNNVTTFNNYYQLYGSLPLFDGFSTLNGFKKARLAKQNSQNAINKARDAKAIEVMQCYVDAVYAEQSIRLAQDKLDESRRTLAKTQRMFELGEKSRPDVAAAEAQVAEDDYNLTHQQNEARKAMLTLKSAMNFSTSEELSLSEECGVRSEELNASEELGVRSEEWASPQSPSRANNSSLLTPHSSLNLNFLPEVQVASAAVKSARYDYLISRASLMPSLSLGGGVATNFYKNLSQSGGGETFSQQFNHNMGEYVYVSLSIPIFNVSSWRSARRAKTAWQTAKIELEETRRKVHDEALQAVMDRDGYAKEIVQMERKVNSDSLAHHLNTRKYEEGMLSTFELRTSAQTLLESRIKLLQMRLLYVMKDRLVRYYQGEALYSMHNS